MKTKEKILEIMSRNMKLDFVPEYKANLQEMVEYTFNEILSLEQVGLSEIDEWGIEVNRIKKLKKELL